jgi:hypothetical protein
MYGPNSRNEMLFEEFLRIRGDWYLKLAGSGEKPTEDGLHKTLLERAGPAAQKDVEQINPGAGMIAEELKQVSVGGSGPGGPADKV